MAKRESNAERRAAEDRRRLAAQAAFYAALLIDYETTLLRAGRGDKRYGTRLREGTADEFYDGERVREKVFYSIGERAYTAIGRLVCEHHDNENPSKFLRWVADYIEGKEPYNPGDNWYDDAIEKAYSEAWNRCRSSCPKVKWPAFYEFEKIFREQNPKLRGASDRSLRRSLRRLGYITRPDKRGRPKEK
jgi:hypothetical protein